MRRRRSYSEEDCLPLQDHVIWFQDMSFNALVSAMIDQDGTYRDALAEEEEKRKRVMSGPSEDSADDAPPKYRLVYTPSAGKSRVPPPSPQWDPYPPQQQMLPQVTVQTQPQQVLSQTPVQSPQYVSPRAPQQKTIVDNAPCFNSGHVEHNAWQGRAPKRGKAPRGPTSTVIQPKGQLRAPMPINGCVNHTTVKDILEGEVLTGTFLLFGHPIIILFDSGASHGFITSLCARRAELSLTVIKPSYMICTLGSRIVSNQIAREVLLELAGQVFPTHLIVLDEQGIDVILGMSWMKRHKAILDIAKQLVSLDSPIYGKVALHLPFIVHIEASVHHTMAKSIEKIPVVREFSDVFHMIYQECLLREELSSK
jgi:hypothetical protein